MPTALFPSQIATDAQLKVAANLIETKLRIAVNDTDTVLFVASTAGFAPNMLVSIGKEIIAIGAVSPAPDSTLTVAAGGRGFDGTAAASHGAGVKVSLLIDAWHHNALAAEVTAIQAALGPNLANISLGGINSGTYDWAAQAPGGNLVVGNNVIMLAPVPQGVNGTDTTHWLYISGGTGPAEAVLITGGTAVSGQASGTLIVNCANAHSGAWTIRSATAGIQEALQMLPATGGEVRIPAVPHTIHAPITVTKEGARITGTTRNTDAAIIRTSGVIFNVVAGSVEISNLALQGGASGGAAAPLGNVGIATTGIRGHYHDLNLSQLYGGLLNAGGFHNIYEDIWCRNLSGYVGKHSGGVGPYFATITHDVDPGYDCAAEAGFVINADGAYIYDVDILHCHHGVVVQPVSARLEWTFIYDARFDQCYTYGVYLLNSSIHVLEGVFMHDVWCASSGLTGTMAGAPPPNGCGLMIENTGSGTIKNVNVVGGQIFNSNEHNVKINAGQDIKIDGVWLRWCNSGDKPNIDNIYVATPGRCEIVNCTIGSNQDGTAPLRSGILAASTTGNLLVRDCAFIIAGGSGGMVEPITNLAANPAAVQNYGFNRGSDDIAHEGVPSAATITLSPRQYHHITGTTNINTILPTWQGRVVYLFNPDAGTWQLTTAGNIANSVNVSTGTNVVCMFTGNKWICWK